MFEKNREDTGKTSGTRRPIKGTMRGMHRWHNQQNDSAGTDWYYIRVTQHNGQMAWSSPVWVG